MIERMAKIWRIFSAAPHRMFFLAGTMQSLCVMIWWLVDLGGRFGQHYAPVNWSMSALDAHAFLMLFGFFPFFIFGFLMTTYPRWMNGEEVERRFYVPAFILMVAGNGLLYVALTNKFWLAVAGVLFLGGWGAGLYALLRVYWRAKHPDKRHALITSIVLALGWLLAASWFAGTTGETSLPVTIAKSGGIWMLLLPVFFVVSHRMIPFFSANVIPGYTIVRPYWALALIWLASMLHGLMEIAGFYRWLWLVDLPMAALALYLTLSWRLLASMATPLLAMLHIGFAWLSVSMLLFGVQSLLLMGGHVLLGRAPLHALVLGYFTSMVLGMVTRVTLGHSGRTLTADRLTWTIFLVFQGAVLLRIASEIPGVGFEMRSWLFLGSALIWLITFGIWAHHFGHMYWTPRSDGKPG